MSGHGRTKAPPKGWLVCDIDDHGHHGAVFIQPRFGVAQKTHPSDAAATPVPTFPDLFRHFTHDNKNSPLIYCFVNPQPPIPDGWIQVAAVPKKVSKGRGIHGRFLYVCVDGVIQLTNPSPAAHVEEHPLPAGWTTEIDGDGDEFWVNRNTLTCTYDDPRVITAPTPSRYLELIENAVVGHSKAGVEKPAPLRTGSKTCWRVGPRSAERFEALSFHLVPIEHIPQCARNKRVNRYLDIIPTKATAVTLPLVEQDGPVSQYINANYVTGARGEPKQFIAAMGPKEQTLGEWWRMIWLENVQAVVMLTNITEKGTKKCESYLPHKREILKPATHDCPFEISLLDREVNHDYMVSTLLVKHNGEQKKLKHYWYHTWPDHDVPREPSGHTYTAGLLQLVEQVRTDCPPGQPIVVHCSAGVGRTGTFLAVHHAQELLRETGQADPLQIVRTLRKQRPAMVQHVSQFYFVHDCVTDWVHQSGKSFVVLDGHSLDPTEQDPDLFRPGTDYAAIRTAEKKAASDRREKLQQELRSGKARRHKHVDAHASGELHVAPIHYRGHEYHFNDVNGDGQLDWSEAQADGWSRHFFDEVAKGSSTVTIVKFTEFRASVKAAELAAKANVPCRAGMKSHPEMANPWYAGEVDMPTAVIWVKGTERGSFLIRRSVSDPSKFHCLVSIVVEGGGKRVGRYELVCEDSVYHLSKKSYASLKDFVNNASTTFVLKDAMGGVKLLTPVVREIMEQQSHD